MEAQDYLVGDLLQGDRHFMVPIYQRRYQWTETELLPFWADVVAKADEVVEDRCQYQHYMGALIWIPSGNGLTTRLHVVDGQQRLTTFSILLAALREICVLRELPELLPDIDACLFNSPSSSRDLTGRVKLVPTPADRDLIQDILASDRAGMRRKYPDYYFNNGNLKTGQTPRALANYVSLCKRIDEYARFGLADLSAREPGDTPDGDADRDLCHRRLRAILEALVCHLKIVVISLGEGDDAQVIFETLNSKGRPLLAMDLVRNNIFHRAEAQGEEASHLYRRLWSNFEGSFWEQPAPRARPVRPRIDHFLSHALTAQTGKQTAIRELYSEYRGFVRPLGKPRFANVEDELRTLTQYAPAYRALEGDLPERTPLAWIGTKLAAWESTIAYPIVFQTAVSDLEEAEKTTIYKLLYAYIVRRAVCGLPNKSLGTTIARVAARFISQGPSAGQLADVLLESTAPTFRFPDDDEFTRGLKENPLYNWFSGGRLPDLLWELELAIRRNRTEAIGRPDGLWVEHVMPQTWTDAWPGPDGLPVSRDVQDARLERRERLLHTIGNLTLTTESLNISLGNGPFVDKLRKLDKESLFILNKELANHASWTETEIEARSHRLSQLACAIWPSAETVAAESNKRLITVVG